MVQGYVLLQADIEAAYVSPPSMPSPAGFLASLRDDGEKDVDPGSIYDKHLHNDSGRGGCLALIDTPCETCQT
jgi:hypothetical protein